MTTTSSASPVTASTDVAHIAILERLCEEMAELHGRSFHFWRERQARENANALSVYRVFVMRCASIEARIYNDFAAEVRESMGRATEDPDHPVYWGSDPEARHAAVLEQAWLDAFRRKDREMTHEIEALIVPDMGPPV